VPHLDVPVGDVTQWGSRSWEYPGMCGRGRFFAANHMELLGPFFDQRTAAYPAYTMAARQDWAAKDSSSRNRHFNGPEKLPDDIARDLQSVLLWAKERRSGCWSSKKCDWAWKAAGVGPRAPSRAVSHDMYWGALTAELYWRHTNTRATRSGSATAPIR